MNARQQGFTLLEILIVISLLGVLLVLVGGALLGANRAVLKAQRYTVSLDEMHAAQQFLRTALAQALPLPVPPESGQPPGIFFGSAQRLAFVAGLPGQLGGGINLYTLSLQGAGAERTLQVAFARVGFNAAGNTYHAWGEPQVLLRDIQQLKFSYQGVSPAGQLTGWLDHWPWPQRLPRAVRIQAKVNAPVPWLTEVVALRLDLAGAGRAP